MKNKTYVFQDGILVRRTLTQSSGRRLADQLTGTIHIVKAGRVREYRNSLATRPNIFEFLNRGNV